MIFDVELIKIIDPPPPTSFNLRIDEEVSSASDGGGSYSGSGYSGEDWDDEDGGWGES